MNKILSVNELNTFLKSILQDSPYLKDISVTGEIGNLVFNKSGHVYFSLKDELSTMSCMIWKTNADKLKRLKPHDGMKITITGSIDFYVPYGKVSFIATDVQVEGIGELQIIFNERKEKLQKAGWFDESIKKPLPKFPLNIGIVTADTGAAIHDLITTINRRWPIANIFLFPSKVQGEGASLDLEKKIIQANNFLTKLDVLIVGRGGGSYEDLWEFNEEPVLRAIRNSQIPIISAVGHEPDVTLSDYVADKRAATPTAAGEIATPSLEEIKQNLIYKQQMLIQKVRQVGISKTNAFNQANTSLNTKMSRLVMKSQNLVLQNENTLKIKVMNLNQSMIQEVKRASYLLSLSIVNLGKGFEVEMNNQSKSLLLLNPTKPLEKGFALLSKNNRVLNASDKLEIGDEIKIIRQFENLDAKIMKKIEKEEKENGSK